MIRRHARGVAALRTRDERGTGGGETGSGLPPDKRRVSASPVARLDQPTRELLVGAIIAVGVVAVCLLWWRDTSAASVHGVGPWLSAAGRVSGLVGSYLVVIEVLLMGRLAWLDRLIGMDRLAHWHRRNGEYCVSLLGGHAVLIIWGYAVTEHTNVVSEAKTVVFSYTDVLAATVGLGLLLGVGVISARGIRRRVSYHTWYFIHLYTYLAVAVSFAHQFATGADFATHPLNRALWVGLYVVAGALLVTYRVGKPIRDALRHRLRVACVVSEGPGLTSIYVTGEHLGELRADSGQFFLWRFVTRNGWWQAHPYSLSSAPNANWLRLTVKDLGDHSSALAHLRPGTFVIAEGPYGAFTDRRRTRSKVLLIGAGIGITPLRALFESLPCEAGDITLIYRARSAREVAFRDELERIADTRRSTLHYLVGSSDEHPEFLTAPFLTRLVPDLAGHDVYVCGPPSMATTTVAALRVAGVSRRRIHREQFEL